MSVSGWGKKHISTTKLSSTLTLTELTDGFWLYDDTRRMNLSVRAKTSQEAFVEALTYYQNRLSEVETKFHDLDAKVTTFVNQFTTPEE